MQTICVLGLGYIGLPTASLFASHGAQVLGVDTDGQRVATLQLGEMPIEEPGLHMMVQAALSSGRLQVSSSPSPADVFIIAVPTPITADKRADLQYVQHAAVSIVPHLRPGCLVILESTCPPGTTLNVVRPILETSGLTVGTDVHLAHCPERVLPGRILKELIDNDRVVGGVTPSCSERARALYATVVHGEILLTEATTAETVKLMENTYRDVNIALANELARCSERLGIDAADVVRLANRHPRVHLHSPGPGVGGHCISVDPWFLVEALPDETGLIRLAREENDRMPGHVVTSVLDWVGTPAPVVAVLGVTYKGNVADTRESPALPIIAGLQMAGATVRAYDPHAGGSTAYPLTDLDSAIVGADVIVVLADHAEFAMLDPERIGAAMGCRRVYDGRRCLDHDRWRSAGFAVRRLGAGSPAGVHRGDD